MNAPVFSQFDAARPWVIVRKDYDEGTRAMWREWSRFASKDEAMEVLRRKREGMAAYEDETGYESMVAYKVVKDESF